MRFVSNAPTIATVVALAVGFTLGAAEVATAHSPALLATARSGDVAALERAIADDLRGRLSAIFASDAELIGFSLHWEGATCHEPAPVWVDIPPVGVCLVSAGAMNVGASYAVVVPAQGPLSYVLLDFAVE